MLKVYSKSPPQTMLKIDSKSPPQTMLKIDSKSPPQTMLKIDSNSPTLQISATSSAEEVFEDHERDSVSSRQEASGVSNESLKAPLGGGMKPFLPNATKNRLEDQMNHEDLELLEQIFEEADEDGGGGLDLDEFREALKRIIANKGGILPDEDELAIIFMKVDANCDGTVDWEEFCSYMLMENQLKDVMSR